jgi:uncharacterized Zn-binding protein involved in type VI secretion
MAAAARIGDTHTCPMANPNGSPHTGGPILPPGVFTVKIGGKPAAVAGGTCTCAGPPDSILKGSSTVYINGMPAARQGDSTVHGGTITSGLPSVIIGD